MENINFVKLRGVIGSVKTRNINEKNLANITVATNYAYMDRKTLTPVIDTVWHNVLVWESKNIPDVSTFAKGDKVEVEGRLNNRRYTSNDGIERYVTEIVANKLIKIDSSETMVSQMA